MIDYSNLKPSDFDDTWCPVCGRAIKVRIGDDNDIDSITICCGCGCVMETKDKWEKLISKTDWIHNELFADMLDAGILEYSHLFPVEGKIIIQNILYHKYNGHLFVTAFYGKDSEGEGIIDTMTVWRQLEGVYKKLDTFR